MNVKAQPVSSPLSGRITSVDFFRGFTMFLLAGEATRLYEHFLEMDSGIMQFFGTQLSHHEWNGLHFWDLIQPFFMFIVGVAIPFAVANRMKKGDSDKKILLHALSRQPVQKLPFIVNNLYSNILTYACDCSNLIIIIIQSRHATQTGRRTKSDVHVQPRRCHCC